MSYVKKKKSFLFVLLFFLFFGIRPPSTVQAANPTKVTLKPNKTYTKYDITGDKKADKIQIKISKGSYSYYNALSVIVNGKTLYRFSGQYFEYYPNYDILARIYTLKNGKPFLYLDAQSSNGDGPVNGIFQYKSGKLKQLVNFHTFLGKKGAYGGHNRGDIVKVSGNTLYTRQFLMSFTLGPSSVLIRYAYKSGTLKRVGSTYSFDQIYSCKNKSRSLTAGKKLTAYTSVSASKKSFSIPKGRSVRIDKCYCNGSKMLIKVTYKGRSGWLKAQTGYPREANKMFSDVVYAG